MQKSASWISSGYALCVVDLLKEKKIHKGIWIFQSTV